MLNEKNMKTILLICSIILFLQACELFMDVDDDEYCYPNTSAVYFFEKHARLEVEDSILAPFRENEFLTYTHYMSPYQTGGIQSVYHSVWRNNQIFSALEESVEEMKSICFGNYEIRYPRYCNSVADSIEELNENMRNGHFLFYEEDRFRRDIYVWEWIIEEARSYQNLLFMVDPVKNDTLLLLHFVDETVNRGGQWIYTDIIPRSMSEHVRDYGKSPFQYTSTLLFDSSDVYIMKELEEAIKVFY